MMHQKIVLTFTAALAAILSGCALLPSSLNPSAPESAAISPQDYLGTWIVVNDSGEASGEVTITASDRKKRHVKIRYAEKKEKDYIPLAGFFFKAGGKTFLDLHVDVEQLVKDAKCADITAMMLSPRHYLFQIVRKDEKRFSYNFAFFFSLPDKNGSKDWKAIPGGLKYFKGEKDELIVINTADELYSFLNDGKYGIPGEEKPGHLIRKP